MPAERATIAGSSPFLGSSTPRVATASNGRASVPGVSSKQATMLSPATNSPSRPSKTLLITFRSMTTGGTTATTVGVAAGGVGSTAASEAEASSGAG
jgi:hypothetical protein